MVVILQLELYIANCGKHLLDGIGDFNAQSIESYEYVGVAGGFHVVIFLLSRCCKCLETSYSVVDSFILYLGGHGKGGGGLNFG